MSVIVIPIVAILVGLFIRSKMLGTLLYLAVQSLMFTFQTLLVVLFWLAGEQPGGEGLFGPSPTGFPVPLSEAEIWGYGLINLALLVAGAAITIGIISLRSRRRARQQRSMNVQPAA